MYVYIHTCTIHVKKNATICKFVHHFLIRNCAALLWFVREAPGFGIAAFFFAKRATFSRQRHHSPRIAALYKTVHCGTAIKVGRFWWGKSGTHARGVAGTKKAGEGGKQFHLSCKHKYAEALL